MYTKTEIQKYSLARAILAAAREDMHGGAGFEFELSGHERKERGLPELMGPRARAKPQHRARWVGRGHDFGVAAR